MSKHREQIAEKLVKEMEQGKNPWESVYSTERPHNIKTGKPYRGMNSFWLSMSGHKDPRWLTYKQAKEIGGQVRKGEKGRTVEYWKWEETKKDKDTGEKKKVKLDKPQVFYARVFNAEQVDGIEPYKTTGDKSIKMGERVQSVISNSSTKLITDASKPPHYRPSQDVISLPPNDAFRSEQDYNATYLHELAHSTGHPERLNRDLSGRFGSKDYAKEELRAEMASVYLSHELGHKPNQEHFKNHASYLRSWASVIKQDKNEIFRASRDAEKIADYVLELEKKKEAKVSTDVDIYKVRKDELKQETQKVGLEDASKKHPELKEVSRFARTVEKEVKSKFDNKEAGNKAFHSVVNQAIDSVVEGKDLPKIKTKTTKPAQSKSAEIER